MNLNLRFVSFWMLHLFYNFYAMYLLEVSKNMTWCPQLPKYLNKLTKYFQTSKADIC